MSKPRKTKVHMSLSDAIDKILDAGLSVEEMQNNSNTSSKVNHIKIIGGVRSVNFWPSTGTVYAEPYNDIRNNVKGFGVVEAIRIAKTGK